MKKKICTYILLFSFAVINLISPLCVLAETINIPIAGVTKISVSKASDSFDFSENKPITLQSNSAGMLRGMNNSDWIQFSVNAEDEGFYALTIAIANSVNNFTEQKFDISVAGKVVHKATAVSGQGPAKPVDNYVGVLKLTKGENDIRLTATSASTSFFYIKLERLTDSDLGDVELSVNKGVYGKPGYLTFSQNSLTALNLKEHEDGFYKVSFNAKSENGGTINISSSGVTKGMMQVNGSSFYDAAFYCHLKSDDTVLDIAGLKGDVDFNHITLTKLSSNAESKLIALKEAVNSAKTCNEISSALDEAEEILHPDGSNPKDEIFDFTPVLTELLNKNFEQIPELTDAYFSACGKELHNPKIMLLCNAEKTNEVQSGNLRFIIDTQRLNVKTVVAAIYEINSEGNILKYVSLKNNEEEKEIFFENVVLDKNKKNIAKIIFIDSIESISPTKTNIYKELYVDKKGSDEAGDGSKDDPFATIKRAKDEVALISDDMTGDIIVNIASGIYKLNETEVFTNEHGGKNGFSVIYRGDENVRPEIIGGERIPQWAPYKNGIYSAPYDSDEELRNLYVNGYPAKRASSKILYEAREYYDNPNIEGNRNGFVIYPYQFPKSISEPDSLELVFKTWWVSQRVAVDNIKINEEEVIFFTDSVYYPESEQNTLAIEKGKTFYVENALELLDEPGEFYYSKKDKRLYYYPKENEIISECEIYAPEVEGLIDVSGSESAPVENIVFENLDIKYGAHNDVSDKGIKFVQADKIYNNMGHPNLLPGQFKVNYTDNIRIENCVLSCLGSGALAMTDGVHNARINGNIIRDVSGSGIMVGTDEHTTAATDAKRCKNINITNNVITRVALEHMGCVGISSYYEKGVNILNNTIKEVPYTGISVGWGWLEGVNYDFGYYNISNNHIEEAMCILDDGAHIYTLGPLSGSIISNNYLKTSGADYGGIYCDTGSNELNISNNVIETKNYALSRWSNAKSILYSSNYALVQAARVANTSTTEIGDITVFDAEDKPAEVEAIILKAGVGTNYRHLLNEAELPEGVDSLLKTTPTQNISWKEYYVPVSGNKEAELNVLYYIDTLHSNSYPNIVGNSGNPYIVYNSGEWVKYRINVLEEGEYTVSTLYSCYTDKTLPQLSVSIDNIEKIDRFTIPSLGSWSEWAKLDLGKVTLTKGTHEITFKVERGGFHMRYFMLNKIKK